MLPIPVYLKTDADAPRPTDPEFYWITQNGTFLCRNHPFFESDVRTERQPRALAPHAPLCRSRYPKIGCAALEYVVGFFEQAFRTHGSEAIVLLYWNSRRKRYRLHVPKQEATVWESLSGHRSPLNVKYQTPLDVAPHELLVGDIHSHGDLSAYASHTDQNDEVYRDGLHAVVGCVDRDLPEFYVDLAIDGTRFKYRPEHFFRGFLRARRHIPAAWMEQLQIVVQRPRTTSYGSNYNHRSNTGYNTAPRRLPYDSADGNHWSHS
jgi:PRTRC genetic system protein A